MNHKWRTIFYNKVVRIMWEPLYFKNSDVVFSGSWAVEADFNSP